MTVYIPSLVLILYTFTTIASALTLPIQLQNVTTITPQNSPLDAPGSLTGLTALQWNLLITDGINVVQPVTLHRWPKVLEVPQYPDMRILVTKTKPLNSFQATDIKLNLNDLQEKSCTNEAGQRVVVQVSEAVHTLTEVVVICEPDVGLGLQDQTARFDAVLEVIYDGQTAYGPAAVDCEIWLWPPAQSMSRKQIGKIGTMYQNAPPPAVSQWTGDSIRLRVSDSPGWRIRVQTDHILGPTLDRWDTLWFKRLCETVIEYMQAAGSPQRPVGKFWWPLPSSYKQQITIKFHPVIVQGSDPPMLDVIIGVMVTLIALFDYQGARPLRFNLLNSQDRQVGVGWMEFGTVPPQLGLTNTTVGSTTE